MPTLSEGAKDGQVLVVFNADEEPLLVHGTGLSIPRDRSVLFVFDAAHLSFVPRKPSAIASSAVRSASSRVSATAPVQGRRPKATGYPFSRGAPSAGNSGETWTRPAALRSRFGSAANTRVFSCARISSAVAARAWPITSAIALGALAREQEVNYSHDNCLHNTRF